MTRAKTRKTRRPGRGTLMIVSGLLVVSAVLRMGSDAGRVMALQSNPEPVASQPDLDTADITCDPAPDVEAMLEAFQKREARIAAREAALTERMQDISVADRAIEARLSALAQAEDKLRKTIALADSAAEDDISRLTVVYENMKPKQAASLFEQMDPEFAAGFLGRMKPEAAAGIMAGLNANTAYTISVVMAGRNASVPKE